MDSPSGETFSLFHFGAGTIRLEIASSLSALSLGGGGQTRDSIMSSVVFVTQVVRSGGSVRLLRIIIHKDISSCRAHIRTNSIYQEPTEANNQLAEKITGEIGKTSLRNLKITSGP